MTILSKIDQKGRSMVEMLGVLAIIGVLSVGGISGYSKAMAKFKLTKAQDQMSMILMNIRTAFATSSSYTGLNNGTAISFGIAPNEMFNANPQSVTSKTRINNAFGGPTYIFSCDYPLGDYDCATGSSNTNYDSASKAQFFAIALENLGREACISLAASDWGTDGLIGVYVDNGTDKKMVGTHQLPILPMGTNDAGTPSADELCAPFGETSKIMWVYY